MKYQLFVAVSLFPLSFFAKTGSLKIAILTIIAKQIISVSVQQAILFGRYQDSWFACLIYSWAHKTVE